MELCPISGDIMKLNKYVFGILIILVSVSLTQATTAEPQILSNSSYIDSSNYFTVVGEVQNNLVSCQVSISIK